MSHTPPNGASRIGLWLSIAVSGAVLISMTGAMFFVAFNTRENSEMILVLDRTVREISVKLNELQDRHTKLEVGLHEIETQFCGEDIVRNLMHANDQRQASIMWEKVFGTKYPTDNAYYPTICNRKSQ